MAMTFLRRPIRLLIAATLAVCLSHPAARLSGQSLPSEIAIVVHPDVPADNLTLADLRLVLLGDRVEWREGLRIVILLRAPVAAERDAAMRVCDMTEAQFRQHWISKVFRGQVPNGPKVTYSMDSTLETVSSTAGAIALVQGPVTSKSVKILKIDGKLPGQAGYPVR